MDCIQVQVEDIGRTDTDLIVIPVPEKNGTSCLKYAPDLPKAPFEDFTGERGETRTIYNGEFNAKQCIVYGVGDQDEIEISKLPELAGDIYQTIDAQQVESAAISFPLYLEGDRTEIAREWSNGLKLAGYEFDKFQGEADEDDQEDTELEDLRIILSDGRSLTTVQRGLDQARSIASSVCYSRDLANHPANELTPDDLAERAEILSEDYGDLSLKIWNQDALISDEMNLLNAVGKGSSNPPRMIQFHYKPVGAKGHVGLAGKGVTFDTGGISIKPSKKMDEMKFDMCGAATVFGIVRAVAELQWPIQLTALVPCAENMPGHRSVKPGDIVSGYAGKSVEILNTDAEGRLCLADALGYISEQVGEDLDLLIDFATLTGACITALGHEAAGLMGNDDELCRDLMDAGEAVEERVWQLPLWEDHTEQMKSEIADVKNMGGDAGAITAGAFLRNFVDEDKIERWAHLDIAGTGWGMKSTSYRPEGGTGFGVRLILRFFQDQFSLS